MGFRKTYGIKEYKILKKASKNVLGNIRYEMVRNSVDELYTDLEAYLKREILGKRHEEIFEMLLNDLKGGKKYFSNKELSFLQTNINELDSFKFNIPIDFWNQKDTEFMHAIDTLNRLLSLLN